MSPQPVSRAILRLVSSARLTAALFAVYLVLIVIGYRQWRASMADA